MDFDIKGHFLDRNNNNIYEKGSCRVHPPLHQKIH